MNSAVHHVEFIEDISWICQGFKNLIFKHALSK